MLVVLFPERASFATVHFSPSFFDRSINRTGHQHRHDSVAVSQQPDPPVFCDPMSSSMLLDMAVCAPFLIRPAIWVAFFISFSGIPNVTAFSYRCSKHGMQFVAVAAPIAIRTSDFSTRVVAFVVLFVSIRHFLLVWNVESIAPHWCFRRIEVHPRIEPLFALKQRSDAVCSIFSNS